MPFACHLPNPLRQLRSLGTALLLLGICGPFSQSALAVGLLVVKGGNASPEFARVIPFGRCEKFAVNYKVQVPGTGEIVVLASDVFGLVEYDPAMLTGNLVDPADFQPIMEVVARTRAMADVHPAVRQAAPKFLQPLEEVLGFWDQGLVRFRGRWMPRQEYSKLLAEEADKEKKAREMGEAMERVRMAELQRREAEAKAMADAAAARVREEERQRLRAEQERQEAKRRAEEAQMKQDRLAAEARQKAEERRRFLEANLEALGATRLGAVARAEWETLVDWQNRQAAGGFRGFVLSRSSLALLKNQYFGKEGADLPAHFGPGTQARLHYAANGRDLMVLVSEGSEKTACLLAFDLPVDSQGIPARGEETKTLGQVLGDVAPEWQRLLPRAITVCLVSLPRTGSISSRAPLAAGEGGGYTLMTRPALAEDGQYRCVLLVVLGFDPGAEPLISSRSKNP